MIKKTLVDQFENVVKEEIRQHNRSVRFTDEALAELKEKFKEFRGDHDKLVVQNKGFYEDTQRKFEQEKESLEDDFDVQRRYIGSSKKKIEEYLASLEVAVKVFVTQEEIKEFEQQFETSILALSLVWKDQKEILSEELYVKSQSLQNEINEVSEKNELENANHSQAVQELVKKVERYILDAAAVLRELQVYKKTMFIMEKKIENLYTLIGRLDKKIEEAPQKVEVS